jgi:chorismate--pyruvate lyase
MTLRTQHPDLRWLPRPVCADPRLRGWLLDRGSLTQRIQARCSGFNVNLLAQRRMRIGFQEYEVLRVPRNQHCLVREVALKCDATPVVFAHSVLEARALRGPWRMLASLGTRPLGAALFADPRVRRLPLRFRAIRRGDALYRRACRHLERPPHSLWARRSLFVLRGSRLMVTEVFLPAILLLQP